MVGLDMAGHRMGQTSQADSSRRTPVGPGPGSMWRRGRDMDSGQTMDLTQLDNLGCSYYIGDSRADAPGGHQAAPRPVDITWRQLADGRDNYPAPPPGPDIGGGPGRQL